MCRYMAQAYQDAMAVVRTFGKPDLFITMTCNPNWEEIARELKPGEVPNDRPDLIARVFRLKKEELLKDLRVKGIFGRAVADVHVIEFQKRGLPHVHILLILGPEDKPRTADDVDNMVSVLRSTVSKPTPDLIRGGHPHTRDSLSCPVLKSQVCAELPDPLTHPRLYSIVTKCMLHGPCGEGYPAMKCMADGACGKKFPKAFQAHTELPADGFPTYQRRDNGARFERYGRTCQHNFISFIHPGAQQLNKQIITAP